MSIRKFGPFLKTGAICGILLCRTTVALADPDLSEAAPGKKLGNPVSLPIQHPLWTLHGSFAPERALPIECGAVMTGALVSWTNTFDREARAYRFDDERVTADLSLAYGPSDGIEIGSHLPLITRGGGVMDRFIENWHDIFQLPNGGRNRFNQGNYEMFGHYHDGTDISLGGSGSGIGNPELWIKAALSPTASVGFDAVKFSASLPGATDSFGHDGTDVGVELLGAAEVMTAQVTWGAGYTLLTDDQIDGVRFRDNLISGFLAAEHPLGDQWLLQGDLLLSSSPLKDVVKYPDYALYFDLGLRYQIDSATGINLMMREDPIGRAAADISFVLGLNHSW